MIESRKVQILAGQSIGQLGHPSPGHQRQILGKQSQRRETILFPEMTKMWKLSCTSLSLQELSNSDQIGQWHTSMTSAIFSHWSGVGSQPVGLWAQAWRIITEPFGAFLKSSSMPSKSMPLVWGFQYRYWRGSVNPAFVKISPWFSGRKMQSHKSIHS